MKIGNILSAYVDFFATEMPPEKLISFKAPKHISKRIAKLVSKKKGGEISNDENLELEKILLLDLFIGLTKAKAYQRLLAKK